MLELYERHLVETCELERYKGINKKNERELYPVEHVPCRVIEETIVVKMNSEETVTSTHTIYLNTKVGDMDVINGKDVLEIVEWKSLLTHDIRGYRVRI